MAGNSGNTAERKRGPGRPFVKGQSGNPNGRPKVDRRGVEMLKRAYPDAVQAVIDISQDKEAKASDRLAASTYIIDRVMGKTATPIIQETHITDDRALSLEDMLAAAREVICGDDYPGAGESNPAPGEA